MKKKIGLLDVLEQNGAVTTKRGSLKTDKDFVEFQDEKLMINNISLPLKERCENVAYESYLEERRKHIISLWRNFVASKISDYMFFQKEQFQLSSNSLCITDKFKLTETKYEIDVEEGHILIKSSIQYSNGYKSNKTLAKINIYENERILHNIFKVTFRLFMKELGNNK